MEKDIKELANFMGWKIDDLDKCYVCGIYFANKRKQFIWNNKKVCSKKCYIEIQNYCMEYDIEKED